MGALRGDTPKGGQRNKERLSKVDLPSIVFRLHIWYNYYVFNACRPFFMGVDQ
jgi:hypothetical protein